MFSKKGVLKNLAKFTGKPCDSEVTLAQVFSCEYCEIFKNTFFYRAPPVAASGKIRTKPLKLAKFQFLPFLATLDSMGSLYIVTY